MCGLGTNQAEDHVSLDGANVPRHWLAYESKLDGLAKRSGSNSFAIYCERIETAKERVS